MISSSLLPAAICSRICRRRSTASSALESAIVWFWQTRQRSVSASLTARACATGSFSVGAASVANAGGDERRQREHERGSERRGRGSDRHDFCSSRTSGRIFFSSASTVTGPICL